jgi:hypothetical protein
MENFRQPYLARSISEFWRRWHISLSTWFRDYVYIPLGGSRASAARYALNLMATFLLSGFWHGANWTFVVWGALHGMYMVLSSGLGRLRRRAGAAGSRPVAPFPRFLQVGWVFGLVSFAWIFFRAGNLTDAWYIATHLHQGVGAFASHLSLEGVDDTLGHMGLSRARAGVLGAAVGMLLLVEVAAENDGLVHRLARVPLFFRSLAFYVLVLSILAFGEFRSAPFIYFQF